MILAKHHNLKKTFLLFASYYFYMCWDWRFAGLILSITLINYWVGPRIAAAKNQTNRKLWLALSLVSSLAILGYFKYANFFIGSMNSLLTTVGFDNELPLLNVLLPIGISFYTFQSISYTLDIYRKQIDPVNSFRDFALFVAYFPQLVAGPIVRASHFLPQLNRQHAIPENAAEDGIALVLRGFIKKIAFADILALHIVDPAFSYPAAFSPLFLLVAIYAYSYQVYMDFSGYTDIARGIAKTLGYDLPINFNRPYKALSISNFWQRWHISMSSFFRDYLYFGLGGSKFGNVYFNLMITFVMIGIWHGAGWNFVVYGLCHATFVCLERWRRTQRKRKGIAEPEYTGVRYLLQIFWIFNVIAFSRLLFRGGSIEDAIHYAQAMTNFQETAFPLSILGAAVLITAVIAHYTPSQWTIGWKNVYCKAPVIIQSMSIVTVSLLLLALSSGEVPFVYFQF